MRVGIGLSENLPIATQARLAADVEHAGFASLWTNEASGRDALLLCHAWGAATTRLDVGVGVVPIWTRSPAQLAMACATLQEATGGRFLLGLGVSHPATMGPRHGAQYRKPLAAVGDLLEILGELEGGGRVDVVGEVLRCEKFSLAVDPLPPPTRRYVGAMGPRMLELAGARADGVLLNWSDADEVARAGATVRSAGGRRNRRCELAGYVRVAVAPTRDAARAALAAQIVAYGRLDAYNRHFERQGHGDAIERALEARRSGADDEGLAEALGDHALDALGWAGSPSDDPAGLVSRFAGAGLDHLVARIVVAGDDPVASINAAVRRLQAVT